MRPAVESVPNETQSNVSRLSQSDDQIVALGFDVNRKSILESDLGRYRFIHFATHGLIDSRYPALSALALSQFNRQGESQDGFLRLHDIYKLKLNADVVVLSACQTALGRQIRSEGLVGLTYGFMYAGADSVLASLWQVPDRATAALMERFYAYLINENLHPAAALRKAQLSVASERRWSNPYFWGAFVLQGG